MENTKRTFAKLQLIAGILFALSSAWFLASFASSGFVLKTSLYLLPLISLCNFLSCAAISAQFLVRYRFPSAGIGFIGLIVQSLLRIIQTIVQLSSAGSLSSVFLSAGISFIIGLFPMLGYLFAAFVCFRMDYREGRPLKSVKGLAVTAIVLLCLGLLIDFAGNILSFTRNPLSSDLVIGITISLLVPLLLFTGSLLAMLHAITAFRPLPATEPTFSGEPV